MTVVGVDQSQSCYQGFSLQGQGQGQDFLKFKAKAKAKNMKFFQGQGQDFFSQGQGQGHKKFLRPASRPTESVTITS